MKSAIFLATVATLLTSILFVTIAPTSTMMVFAQQNVPQLEQQLQPQNNNNNNDDQQQVKPDKPPGKPDKTQKPDKPQKPQKQPNPNKNLCQVNKVLLQVIGITPLPDVNQTVTANLQGFADQQKIVEPNETSVAFNFNYGKNPTYCPPIGDILTGYVNTIDNTVEYDVEITGKNNKKILDLSTVQVEIVNTVQ